MAQLIWFNLALETTQLHSPSK